MNTIFSASADSALELTTLMEHLNVSYKEFRKGRGKFIEVLDASKDQLELLWNASLLMQFTSAFEVDSAFSRGQLVAMWDVVEYLPEHAQGLLNELAELM